MTVLYSRGMMVLYSRGMTVLYSREMTTQTPSSSDLIGRSIPLNMFMDSPIKSWNDSIV